MYLELADSPTYLQDNGIHQQGYIFIPANFFPGMPEGGYIREDKLDELDDQTFDYILQQLEPYQPGVSFLGFGKKAKERRKKRKAERIQKRADKRAGKESFKLAKIQARGEGGGFFGGLVKGIFGGGEDEGDYEPYVPGPGAIAGPVPDAAKRIAEEKAAAKAEADAKKMKTLIYSGIGVVVVGGGIYLMTRKK